MKVCENQALVIKGKKEMGIESRPLGEPGPEGESLSLSHSPHSRLSLLQMSRQTW